MTLKKFIRKQFRKLLNSDFCSNIISGTLCNYTKMVQRHTKWQINGWDNFEKSKKDGAVFVAWHGRALMFPSFFKQDRIIAALVSPHRDGQLIAKLLKKTGIHTINGSSNENAAGAAVELMHALQKNASIFIVSDGPRGPRMHLGKSPLYYAQKTGKPIITITYSIANSFIIKKAWDNMMIPVPFSQGILEISQPIYIPKDASPEELEQLRQKIETDFNTKNIEIDKKLGLEPVQPDINSAKRKKYSKRED